jgi:iron complex outermembrane receptor protein
MKKQKGVISMIGLLCLASFSLHAQEEKKQEVDSLYTLSLEALMNVPIQSASKKAETLFDAPLSSYTITRSDIDKSGITNIMEALRLAPGVIVREMTNGEYDIHIRGMENLTRTNGAFFKQDAYTLVMIDNRPVFNHGLGGTYWESLPVDLNDVDRIEIVRGPSSPLFGPNAVTGVINIITRRMKEEKTIVNATVQAGTLTAAADRITIGQKFGDKFSAIISGNLQDRSRFQNVTYESSTGNYLPLSTAVPNYSRALNKWGINGYFTYKMSGKSSIDLTLSDQSSAYQRSFLGTGFDQGGTDTKAANLAVTLSNFKLRSSYQDGHMFDTRVGIPHGEYDYHVADASAEYDVKFSDKYTVTPGASLQSVTFDDRKYTNPGVGNVGYFNGVNSINTTSGFVRTDLNFTEKLRVIGGLRVDNFSSPNQAYLAYELATTYKINSKNLVRFAVTRSNSGSFIGYNFLNIGGGQIGNNNLKIFTLDMVELGYRVQLTDKLQFDVDVFQQSAKNLTAILQNNGYQQFANVPTTAVQQGATFGINFVPNDKIQFKPFLTIQTTQTKDLPSLYIDPAFAQAASVPLSYSSNKNLYTPGSFGGFYFNYHPLAKLNVNVSGYYFSKQTAYDASYDASNPSANPAQYAQGQIAAKLMINAKVSYEITKGLAAYVSGRNVFNATSREFYGADQTQAMVFGGVSYRVN